MKIVFYTFAWYVKKIISWKIFIIFFDIDLKIALKKWRFRLVLRQVYHTTSITNNRVSYITGIIYFHKIWTFFSGCFPSHSTSYREKAQWSPAVNETEQYPTPTNAVLRCLTYGHVCIGVSCLWSQWNFS